MRGPRLRIRFSKHGKVRFTSHRDVARIWERSLRRAGIPVACSAGFSPRPKISFGLALPTGYSSDAEYLDVEVDPVWAAGIDGAPLVGALAESLAMRAAGSDEATLVGALAESLAMRLAGSDEATLVGALTASLPAGMAALAAVEIVSGEPSLQHAVTSCTWRIDAVGSDAHQASQAVSRAMDGGELLVQRERKGRLSIDNIRPAVHAVEVDQNITGGVRLTAELATQPRAVRPNELLASLRPPLRLLRARRLHQWITTDAGERREPLAVAELSVAGAGVEP